MGRCKEGTSHDIFESFLVAFDAQKIVFQPYDATYTVLLTILRQAMKVLAERIEPKVYAYGFLKKIKILAETIFREQHIDVKT